MFRSFRCAVLLALAPLVFCGLAAARPAAKPATAAAQPTAQPKAVVSKSHTEGEHAPAKAAKDEKPSTSTVKKVPLRVELKLKGVFEAEDAAEIVVRPELWSSLEVTKAVQHGVRVKRGEVLIRFDAEKLDEEIADLRNKQAIGKLSFEQAEENLRALEATTPLDLQAAVRAKTIATEDRDFFFKIVQPLVKKSTDFFLTMAERNLEYQKEELAQLEKMYKANDLTEATEEIVLKRQRNTVAEAEFHVEIAKATHDEAVRFLLPRRSELVEQGAVRQDVASTKAKVVLPLILAQQRRELARLKLERTREDEKLKKLLADREMMTVKSPMAGVVYYGRFARGKWTGTEKLADDLHRGGNIARNTVVMTIVRPRPLQIRASLCESQLSEVRLGLKGTVQSPACPGVKLDAEVVQLDAIPSASDTFDLR
ncbi:MAG: hypothetical protein ABSH20_26045, partial [Tepidisphaeraceae bacterium]